MQLESLESLEKIIFLLKKKFSFDSKMVIQSFLELVQTPRNLNIEKYLLLDHFGFLVFLDIKEDLYKVLDEARFDLKEMNRFKSVVVAKELERKLNCELDIPIEKIGNKSDSTFLVEFFYLNSLKLDVEKMKELFFNISHVAFRFKDGITAHEIFEVLNLFFGQGYELIGGGYNKFENIVDYYTQGVILVYLKNGKIDFKIEILISGHHFFSVNQFLNQRGYTL